MVFPKKILNICQFLLIGFLAMSAAMIVISTIPIPGNYKILSVLSGSMEPALKVGNLIVIVPAFGNKVGDIITFEPSVYSKTSVTRRIFAINQNSVEV